MRYLSSRILYPSRNDIPALLQCLVDAAAWYLCCYRRRAGRSNGVVVGVSKLSRFRGGACGGKWLFRHASGLRLSAERLPCCLLFLLGTDDGYGDFAAASLPGVTALNIAGHGAIKRRSCGRF